MFASGNISHLAKLKYKRGPAPSASNLLQTDHVVKKKTVNRSLKRGGVTAQPAAREERRAERRERERKTQAYSRFDLVPPEFPPPSTHQLQPSVIHSPIESPQAAASTAGAGCDSSDLISSAPLIHLDLQIH